MIDKIIDTDLVKKYGYNAGASEVGIVSSSAFNSAPTGFKPLDVLKSCFSVIVLGTPFPKEALSMNTSDYTDIRNTMVSKIDNIAKEVAKLIKSKGFQTKVIGSVNTKGYNGPISLKHAAELAGLGIIGRNYLLTNKKYGNLLFFSAVLTNAELVPDKKAEYMNCDYCYKCVEICPAKALNNPDLFNKKECAKVCIKIDKKVEYRCYLCRKVCPNSLGIEK